MVKKNTKTFLWIGAILLIGLLVVNPFSWKMPSFEQTAIPSGGSSSQPVTQQVGCAINPSVVTAVTDSLNSGTSVSTTNSYKLNGQYTGTTAPTTLGTADVLFNASGYLNKIKTGVTINCGSNLIVDNVNAYANATLTYYADNGVTVLTASTSNETVKSAGATYNWKLRLQGTDKKSTGKQLLLVELSVPANVTSVSLNGGESVVVPNGYSRQSTNSYVSAFLLPAITGNTESNYNLAVQSATSKIVQGTVYTTIYSVEPFVETDGTFSDKGLAFNSVNTAKFHDSQTKNFIIA